MALIELGRCTCSKRCIVDGDDQIQEKSFINVLIIHDSISILEHFLLFLCVHVCTCAFVYACVHLCVHVCIWVCMCAHVCACVHLSVHACTVCICVCMYAFVCACVHLCMHVCTCVCMCAFVCACVHCVHLCMHVCICVCTCVCMCMYGLYVEFSMTKHTQCRNSCILLPPFMLIPNTSMHYFFHYCNRKWLYNICNLEHLLNKSPVNRH